ncbi:anti-sigma factor domain-containing protein [Cohnella thermotolerans]|uniref:anti-sigma factor domain-containing protein n=1 Tax=Cohnella thermotolerans TaxID=329858 RepID=UPI00040A8A50|nr:anti-sigma factor [Cohnella thermotolerans]
MDERKCRVPEEWWIDWHLGRLQPAEAEALVRHRDGCPDCAASFRQWSELLGSGEAARELPERSRRRLRAEMRMRGFVRRAVRALSAFRLRRAAWATAGAGLAIAVFACLLFVNEDRNRTKLEPEKYALLHEPEGAEIMSRPDTVVYSMSDGIEPLPAGAANAIKETVWINVRTHELFLLLEGMLPSDDLDVQAWATSGTREANLGLLQFHQNRAHLYASGVRPELWDSLALTIEPKGGSVRPTSPQTAALLLRR